MLAGVRATGKPLVRINPSITLGKLSVRSFDAQRGNGSVCQTARIHTQNDAARGKLAAIHRKVDDAARIRQARGFHVFEGLKDHLHDLVLKLPRVFCRPQRSLRYDIERSHAREQGSGMGVGRIEQNVRAAYSRQEEFSSADPAPESRIRVKIGAKRDGTLVAVGGLRARRATRCPAATGRAGGGSRRSGTGAPASGPGLLPAGWPRPRRTPGLRHRVPGAGRCSRGGSGRGRGRARAAGP